MVTESNRLKVEMRGIIAMFKICLIGCGVMARNQHGPACKMYEATHKNVTFAACCDINEERAKTFAQDFGLSAWYTNIDTMLDTERPQAVCLIAPVEKTAELSCKILEKGYPLILEKPPGMTGEEARRMINTAKNTPNQVAFNRRYMPIVQKAKSLLEEWGGTSCIMDIQYRMVRANRRDPEFATTAIHGIDLVKYLAGSDYKHVNFQYHELPEMGETVANFYLNCQMENNIITNLAFLPISHINTERVEINTTKGLLCLHLPIWSGCYDQHGKITFYSNNEKSWEINGTEITDSQEDFILGGFYNENAQFFDALRNGTKPDGDIASGLQSVEIANCITQRLSHYGG